MGWGHWPLPLRPIYEGFIGVGVRMRRAAQAVKFDSRRANLITYSAGSKTFT